MSGVTLKITDEQIELLEAQLEELGQSLSGDAIRLVMGRSIQETLVRHFNELANDSVHHKTADSFGAGRTGFYEQAADAVSLVNPEIEPEGVSVSITGPRGIAQRLFGGPISRADGGYLTIPARTEAYGKRAREFSDLEFILFGRTGTAALAQKETGLVYFWLVREVTQAPDPTVLPEEEEMLNPAIAQAQKFIDDLWSEREAA